MGTEDDNICFSNKTVTVGAWGRSSRQHWGPAAALQLQKQLALDHSLKRLCPGQPLLTCLLSAKLGSHGCSQQHQACLSACILALGRSPFQEEPGSHSPPNLPPASRGRERDGKSTGLGVKGTGFSSQRGHGLCERGRPVCPGPPGARGFTCERRPVITTAWGCFESRR